LLACHPHNIVSCQHSLIANSISTAL
jgi:hypothetical protein